MDTILDPLGDQHRAILDERLAAYRSGKSKPISHQELMRRVRADEPKKATPSAQSRMPSVKPNHDAIP
jgi:hypothetical protein